MVYGWDLAYDNDLTRGGRIPMIIEYEKGDDVCREGQKQAL